MSAGPNRYERLWERLLEFLDGWASATEVAPGRIEVTTEGPDGTTGVVEIVMTRDEWDDMVAIPWGSFDHAARAVRRSVLDRAGERFLVYHHYELVPSATEELPVDPEIERLNELARQHPEGIGRWVVQDRDGNVVDEFRSHPD